jgi:signal transduction histidine kinase
MKSLQLRLGAGLLISLISVFMALWWMTSSSIRYLAEEYVASHLAHDAESIVEATYFDDSNNLALASDQVEPIYLQPFSGQYYQVTSAGRVLRSSSLVDQNLTIPILTTGETRRLYRTGPQQQALIIMAYGYNRHNRMMTVAVAEDLSPMLTLISAFQHRYALIALALLLVLIAVQAIILHSGFHPLKRIQQQIRDLEKGERTQLDTQVPLEVSALVAEVNWLLNVLEQRLQRSRNALGDLAHALKTPLTVLQQLAREDALQGHIEICHTLEIQTTNMQSMMARVLKRARMAGSGPSLAKFDIAQEIPALIHVLQSMYRDKNISISFNPPVNGTLSIDREDMLELAGNLLDNACKWARSSVALSFFINHEICMRVEDDGPGVSEADIAQLQRGVRLDETVSGHGLGLSIAQLIAEQYGGHLNLGRSNTLGGFCAEAVLYKTEP